MTFQSESNSDWGGNSEGSHFDFCEKSSEEGGWGEFDFFGEPTPFGTRDSGGIRGVISVSKTKLALQITIIQLNLISLVFQIESY